VNSLSQVRGPVPDDLEDDAASERSLLLRFAERSLAEFKEAHSLLDVTGLTPKEIARYANGLALVAVGLWDQGMSVDVGAFLSALPSTRAATPEVARAITEMQFGGQFGKKGGTYGAVAKVDRNARPLSPGSNYPTTKNIQTQRNGFGTWLQKFETTGKGKKSKYGMPIFLPNGNVNPAYLAAERKDIAAKKKLNMKATEAKRKKLIANDQFELAGYIRKAIGNVGSGKEYYQSGK